MFKNIIRKLEIVFIVTLLTISCQQRNINTNINSAGKENLFDIDSVEIINLGHMAADYLEINDLFLARPTSIAYHKDDFLLLNDGAETKQLLIIDLKNNTFCREVGKGRAKNELLYLWDVVVSNDDIFLSSLNEKKGLKMEYDPAVRRFVFAESMMFPQQFMHCSPTNSGYLTFASASSANRFVVWSEIIEPIDTLGSFPEEGIINHKYADNGALQSDFAFSPDGDMMAVAYKNIDYIDLYQRDSLIKRIRGPRKFEVTVRKDELGNGASMTYVTPLHFSYRSIVASPSGFWAGYIGLKPPQGMIPTQDMNRIREIYFFDWNGNLQKIYKLENPIEAFAVNESSNVMYCLLDNPEPSIVKYRL
jgi:hypothetical protein